MRTTDEALLTVQEMIDRYDAMTPDEQRTIEALYRGERLTPPEPTVPSPDNTEGKARVALAVRNAKRIYGLDEKYIDGLTKPEWQVCLNTADVDLAALDRAGLMINSKEDVTGDD